MATEKPGTETKPPLNEQLAGAESFADFQNIRNGAKKDRETVEGGGTKPVSVKDPNLNEVRQARTFEEPPATKDDEGGDTTTDADADAGGTKEDAGTKADGDGKSDQQTWKDADADGDGKSEKPGDRQSVEGHIKRRLGREKRKHDREMQAKDAEIARLQEQLNAKGEQKPDGEGDTTAKPEDDAGTKADTKADTKEDAGTEGDADTEPQMVEAYLDAWAVWDEKAQAAEEAGTKSDTKDDAGETKDEKTDTEPKGGSQAAEKDAGGEKPNEGQRDPVVQQALDDIIEIVEGDDDIGEKFADGVEGGDIVLSDVAVGYLDTLDDEQVLEVAKKLVEDPRLSRRIARSATPRSQLAKLKKLHSDNAGTEGSGTTQRRQPLRPTRGQAPTKSLTEIAKTGSYAEFAAARNSRRQEQQGQLQA